jgi:hypothetical protein
VASFDINGLYIPYMLILKCHPWRQREPNLARPWKKGTSQRIIRILMGYTKGFILYKGYTPHGMGFVFGMEWLKSWENDWRRCHFKKYERHHTIFKYYLMRNGTPRWKSFHRGTSWICMNRHFDFEQYENKWNVSPTFTQSATSELSKRRWNSYQWAKV